MTGKEDVGDLPNQIGNLPKGLSLALLTLKYLVYVSWIETNPKCFK